MNDVGCDVPLHLVYCVSLSLGVLKVRALMVHVHLLHLSFFMTNGVILCQVRRTIRCNVL